jgi:hypothetical protein
MNKPTTITRHSSCFYFCSWWFRAPFGACAHTQLTAHSAHYFETSKFFLNNVSHSRAIFMYVPYVLSIIKKNFLVWNNFKRIDIHDEIVDVANCKLRPLCETFLSIYVMKNKWLTSDLSGYNMIVNIVTNIKQTFFFVSYFFTYWRGTVQRTNYWTLNKRIVLLKSTKYIKK